MRATAALPAAASLTHLAAAKAVICEQSQGFIDIAPQVEELYKFDVDTTSPLDFILGEPMDTTCGLLGLCWSRYSASHLVGFAGFSWDRAANASVKMGSNSCVLAYSSADRFDMTVQ